MGGGPAETGSKHEEMLKDKYGSYTTTLDSMERFILWTQKPVTWFREKIVEPNRSYYPWYHRQFRRVPEIDQCYTDDYKCFFEADMQYKRDKMVDQEVVEVLKRRKDACYAYEGPDAREKCAPIYEDFLTAVDNYFIKYGDLGYTANVKTAYMKQKHRLVWEKRYGPVGTGNIPIEERRKMEEAEMKKARLAAEESE